MPIVPLNRRFVEWNEKEPTDPEFRQAMGLGEGGVGWDELLEKRRVVILAEAGSGKSTEMAERARLTAAGGRFAFHATVADVGRDGLEDALSSAGRAALAAWKASAADGWFFLDSVDEAKSSGLRLERVVRKFADGILGGEERAHLILSGRVSDWEFRKDLESLKHWLPVSERISMPGTTPEEELLRIVRQERQREAKPPTPELPYIAVMAPLNRDRIRLFAEAKGVPDLDRFLEQIDAANLWHFARRPLDLDWLVRFWQSEGRLGSLAEMVERSIVERLKEANTGRARTDTLDDKRAIQGVERIAAAMVFGRKNTVSIPDGEIAFTSDSPLDLADVLPDWSADDRLLLLSRPIFDPATLGRARFHNDNEGLVRGYLAARWLARLRGENLPTGHLFALLFAKSYGLEVVKPSASETTAWLALWDKDVANELVRINPLLLLGAGDPATLPRDVRRDALVRLISELTSGDHELPWWDNDKLRRFAQPDLGETVASLWPTYRSNKEAAQLLMRIAWLGSLKECASLAFDAIFEANLDGTTRVFAGRTLLATADEQTKQKYAGLVIAGQSTLPSKIVSEAMMDLFPRFIGLPDLLAIIESLDVANEKAGLGFEWEGPRLADKLDSPSDLEQLLGGLFKQLGGELGEHSHHEPTKREEAYFPAITTAALRLLKALPADSAPELAIDAILRVSHRRNHNSKLQTCLREAYVELHKTSSRRRVAFWRVAESLRRPTPEWRKIEHPWQIEMMGYAHGLKVEDVDPLLADCVTRGENDCRLGINTGLALHQTTGSPVDLLEKIRIAAASDPVASEAYEAWMQPKQPSVEHIEAEQHLKEIEAQNALHRDKRDQSWIDFVRDIRADPARIARLKILSTSGVSTDLLELWQLLRGADNRNRYAIDSVFPVERIAGAEVSHAVREGLITHWKNSAPLLRSQKEANDWNSVRYVDLMGIAGVSLEAANQPGWAKQLSSDQAIFAAGYATLELNGFPHWLTDLMTSRPSEVRTVLMGEILDEISRPDLTHYGTLGNVARADNAVVTLVAPALLDDLEIRAHLPSGALSHVLQIIVQGIPKESTTRFVKLGVERFETDGDASVAIQYLAAVFSLDAAMAMDALTKKLASVDAGEQTTLLDRFLAATFGDSFSGSAFKPGDSPPEILEQLVRLTFQTNSQAAARQRPAGQVYQLDENDHADHARGAVFNRFAKTPGAYTFQALLRLQKDPACPVPPTRLQAIAEDRAIQDSESAPWVPSDALAFEQEHEALPRTAKDLQSVLLRRLEDMQHDLLHGDFSQGLTLKALPHEVDVQNWVADRLRLKQRLTFSVERETHVAGEKEPDIRVRAKATDAAVAMEIKVAETWTLKELEDALEVQLCGQYLRAQDGRYGVLLLVHQKPRVKGWEDAATGAFLSFEEVVPRLSAKAALIAGSHHDAPQPEVAVLDVSSC